MGHAGHVCAKVQLEKCQLFGLAGQKRGHHHQHRFARQLMGVKSEQWVSISIYDRLPDYPGQWGSLSAWMGSWLGSPRSPLEWNDITPSSDGERELEAFLWKVLPHRWKFFCISFTFWFTLPLAHSQRRQRSINYSIWLPADHGRIDGLYELPLCWKIKHLARKGFRGRSILWAPLKVLGEVLRALSPCPDRIAAICLFSMAFFGP